MLDAVGRWGGRGRSGRRAVWGPPSGSVGVSGPVRAAGPRGQRVSAEVFSGADGLRDWSAR